MRRVTAYATVPPAKEFEIVPPPYVPKYVSPKQAAQDRARRRAVLYWTVLAIPLAFAVLVFGYSDQSPDALRSATIALDRSLGYPLARLLGIMTTP
jgi:hypothetical protein